MNECFARHKQKLAVQLPGRCSAPVRMRGNDAPNVFDGPEADRQHLAFKTR
jgi:hypothetical protein